MEPRSHTSGRPLCPLRPLRPLARNLFLIVVGGVLGSVLTTYSLASAHPFTTRPAAHTSRSTGAVPAPETDRLREAAIARVSPAIVEVKGNKGLGSGVILTKDGYIVTNNHVVAGEQQISVRLPDGHTYSAKVVGADAVDDLAVVKIGAGNLPTATLGNSADLKVGQSVLAIGNPLGIVSTVTDGIVSALHRSVQEGQNTNGSIPNAIQTSAAINPGNSGGALIDLSGQVVGIPTLTAVDPEFNAPAAGVGFAIPSDSVKSIAQQITTYGKVLHSGRAALGIEAAPQPVTPALAQQYNLPVDHGILIARVASNGPAARAELQQGDIIVKVGSTTIATYEDLLGALSQQKPGDTVRVTAIDPQHHQHTYQIKLGELNVNSNA